MIIEERDKIMDKINKLTHDDLFFTELEAKEWTEWEMKSRQTEVRKKVWLKEKKKLLKN